MSVGGGGMARGIAVSLFLTLAAFVLPLCLSGTVGSVAAEQQESCTTEKCHSAMGKDKKVHSPVAAGDCLSCHTPLGSHKFAPITKVSELCYLCHEKVDTRKLVHQPVREGKCTACHNPHQSPFQFQLRTDVNSLCVTCHDKKYIQAKFLHGPVPVSGCTICHNPHEGDHPRMLMATGNGVCFTCHTDKAEKFKKSAFIHKPVLDLCTGCHNPHGGAYRFNFDLDSSETLCFKCHKDKQESIAKVKVKHGGLATEKKCVACHVPHTADYAKQLMKDPMNTCLMCHDRPLGKPGSQITNMKEHLEKNKEHHGPILENDCAGCHNTHGSDNYKILKKYYLPTFYAPFKQKNFELCFSCHEKTLALDAQTTTATGFRNGDQNLHFVHVNKPDKGRTCSACHDPHATSSPKHVRDKAPFGVWGMPVGFTKTANGGSCLPGCHQAFGYDRVKPVVNRGPQGTGETKSAPAAKVNNETKVTAENKINVAGIEPVAAKVEGRAEPDVKAAAETKSKGEAKAATKDRAKRKKSSN